MKVVFCWSAISGYMAACWRELARRSGIDLHVIAHAASGRGSFEPSLMDGISFHLLDEAGRHDDTAIRNLVREQQPAIVATTGWWLGPYRRLVHCPQLSTTKFVMGVDSPWRHEAQFLTRLRYGRSLRKFDHFFVTGERSWQYVTRLGVPADAISLGMYGVDVDHWDKVAARRDAAHWPRKFVFMGRYEHVKAIDVLVAGYQAYRGMVQEPWPLVCCGAGSARTLLTGAEGVIDKGFLQPAAMVDVLAQCGAFVLPSRFDPWPLAIVEAAAAGLPIICSDACGSAVEVVRPYYNGLVVPKESPAALARAFAAIHDRADSLATWGRRSTELARPYSAEFWADRWTTAFARLMTRSA